MKRKNVTQTAGALAQLLDYDLGQSVELLQQMKTLSEMQHGNHALKNHLMELTTLSTSSKLFLVYLIDNGITTFNSTDIYTKLNFSKPHFLRYVKPELIAQGWIKTLGRSLCEFMNPNSIF